MNHETQCIVGPHAGNKPWVGVKVVGNPQVGLENLVSWNTSASG